MEFHHLFTVCCRAWGSHAESLACALPEHRWIPRAALALAIFADRRDNLLTFRAKGWPLILSAPFQNHTISYLGYCDFKRRHIFCFQIGCCPPLKHTFVWGLYSFASLLYSFPISLSRTFYIQISNQSNTILHTLRMKFGMAHFTWGHHPLHFHSQTRLNLADKFTGFLAYSIRRPSRW